MPSSNNKKVLKLFIICYRFWVLDKDFGAAHLILVIIHVDRAQQVQHPLLLGPPPARPGLSRQNGVPEKWRQWEKFFQQQHSHTVTWSMMKVYLIINLLKTRLYANPALLTRMFSRSPRYSTWCLTLAPEEWHLLIHAKKQCNLIYAIDCS